MRGAGKHRRNLGRFQRRLIASRADCSIQPALERGSVFLCARFRHWRMPSLTTAVDDSTFFRKRIRAFSTPAKAKRQLKYALACFDYSRQATSNKQVVAAWTAART